MAENRWTSADLASRDVVRANMGYLTFTKAPGWTDSLVYAIKSFELPTVTITPLDIVFGHDQTAVAGRGLTNETIAVVFLDIPELKVVEFLFGWQKKIYNPVDKKMYSTKELATIKSPGTLQQTDLANNTIRTWAFKGAWPLSVDYGGTVTMGDAVISEIACTFQVDHFQLQK